MYVDPCGRSSADVYNPRVSEAAPPPLLASPASPPPGIGSRPAVVLVALCGALGAVIRLPFIDKRPLWFDELGIASRLLNDGLLFRITDPQAPAPPGFHVLVWMTVRLLGKSEWVWRLWPYLLGVGSVALIALLLARLAGPWAAVAGAYLLATRAWPVAYSAELKPYSSDGFFALLCLLAAQRIFASTSLQALLAAGACFALAPWFSYTSIFVIGGVLIAGLLSACRRERRRELLPWTALAAGSAASIAILYLLVISPQRARFLLRWWERRGGFPPTGSASALLQWLARNLEGLFDGLLIPNLPYAGIVYALLFLAGCLWLFRRGSGRLALAVAASLLLPLAASFLRLYPFAASGAELRSRVMLFFVPLVLVIVSCGIIGGMAALERARFGPAMAGVILVLLFWPGLSQIPLLFRDPVLRVVEPNRDLFDILRRSARPDDLLFVNYPGWRSFYMYGDGIPCRATVGVRPRAYTTSVEELTPQIAPLLKSEKRVWLFCCSPDNPEENERLKRTASLYRSLKLVAGEGNTLLFLSEPPSAL